MSYLILQISNVLIAKFQHVDRLNGGLQQHSLLHISINAQCETVVAILSFSSWLLLGCWPDRHSC